MNPFVFLGGAIVFEVLGTSLMKASDGFTRPWPGVGAVVAFVVCFYLLSQTLKTIPVGLAYAIWSGCGIVLISAVGWVVYGQRLDLPAIAGIALIMAGVLVINLLSSSTAH